MAAGSGYTRRSIADIVNGENITAPPINAEYNAIETAFDGTDGHSHDGTLGNAPPINLVGSITGYLPAVHGGVGGKNNTTATANPTGLDDSDDGYAAGSIWVNTTTRRVFVCTDPTVGSSQWHEFANFTPQGHIIPEAGTSNIGSTTDPFQNLYLSGSAVAANFDGVLGANTPANINGTVIVAGTPSYVGTDSGFYGNLFGTATGNFKGNIYSSDNSTIILNHGTDGTDAQFVGSVTGPVTGNVDGDVTGDLTGNSAGTHTGPVDADNNVITNVATPVDDTDAASKGYVLNQLSLGVNSVDQYREDAQKLAINPEDSDFTISTGASGYSALHHAAKAEASASEALGYRNTAEEHKDAAELARTIASQKAALVSNTVDSLEQRLIGVLI